MVSKPRIKKPVGYDERTIARLVGEYIVRYPGKTSLQISLAVVDTDNKITKDEQHERVERAATYLKNAGLVFSRLEYLQNSPKSYVKDSSGKFASGTVYRPRQGVGLKYIEEFFNTKTSRVYGPS